MDARSLLIFAAFVVLVASDPQRPKWPSRYYVRGTFEIPYGNLVEPIEIWYDSVGNRELINYYHGMDEYLWRFDQNTLYQIIPRVDKMVCFSMNGIGNGPLTTVLPDLSTWDFIGSKERNSISCNVWQQVITKYNKTAIYTMYTSVEHGAPVELYLDGYDFVFGSHPDIYIMRYDTYTPNHYDASVFNPPKLCNSSEPMSTASFHRSRALMGQFNILTPPSLDTDDHFDLFALKHKKIYGSKEEYQYRRDIFFKNLQFIENHNKRTDVTFKLGMNHLGDLTQNEVRELLMANKNKKSAPQFIASRYHEVSNNKLPAYINWVEKGAVTRVKDQGVCGSCWTFATTGTLEGAWYVKTGQLIPLSEQQIVDCAWGTWITGNSGCDGGLANGALQWIMDNGGIATETTYPYLMQDHWCNAADLSSSVKVKGYVNVTEFSESALKDAIATRGPVAVAIDASHPEFTFYTEGVYYQSNCAYLPDQLDHAVLAVGYGTDNGQDYWLVKNSWSTHWGADGYVKMARNRNNNCGIASQANYPLV